MPLHELVSNGWMGGRSPLLDDRVGAASAGSAAGRVSRSISAPGLRLQSARRLAGPMWSFDLTVPRAPSPRSRRSRRLATSDPDVELAVMALDTPPTLFVERAGAIVAAVELVSPRNKDRPEARSNYLNRYAGYLFGEFTSCWSMFIPGPPGSRSPTRSPGNSRSRSARATAADGRELPRGRAGRHGRAFPRPLASAAGRRARPCRPSRCRSASTWRWRSTSRRRTCAPRPTHIWVDRHSPGQGRRKNRWGNSRTCS